MIFLQCNEDNRPVILDTIFEIDVRICYLRGYEKIPALIIDPQKSTSIRHPEIVGTQPPIDCIIKMLEDALATVRNLKIQQS